MPPDVLKMHILSRSKRNTTDKSIAEIVLEMFSYSDGATMSGKKMV